MQLYIFLEKNLRSYIFDKGFVKFSKENIEKSVITTSFPIFSLKFSCLKTAFFFIYMCLQLLFVV